MRPTCASFLTEADFRPPMSSKLYFRNQQLLCRRQIAKLHCYIKLSLNEKGKKNKVLLYGSPNLGRLLWLIYVESEIMIESKSQSLSKFRLMQN